MNIEKKGVNYPWWIDSHPLEAYKAFTVTVVSSYFIWGKGKEVGDLDTRSWIQKVTVCFLKTISP